MVSIRELDALSLIATKTTRAADAEAWSGWLDEHAARHGGALWALLDPAPPGQPGAGHSHVLHLPTERTDDFDAATTIVRDDAAATHAEIQRDEWVRAGDGIVHDPDAEPTGLIAAQVLCTDPARADEWDAWYDEQHLPDMMTSGGFVSGTRWVRRAPRPGTANHLTIYEIAGLTVAEAIERSTTVMYDAIARGRKHERHAGGLTWALRRPV